MWPLDSTGRYELASKTDRRRRPLQTVICMDTGLVRNDPVPDDAELAQFYAEDYRIRYKRARKPRRRQILRNFRRAAVLCALLSGVVGTHKPRVGRGSWLG